MIRDLSRSLLFQSAARLLVGAQIVVGLPSPAWAQSATAARPQAVAPKPTAPEAEAPAPKAKAPTLATARPTFSATPTDAEFFQSRLFSEPLLPVGAPTRPDENRALARALTAFREHSQDSEAAFGDTVQPVEAFLAKNPSSPWRASLLTNLGMAYRRTGYFSRALRAWEEAWNLAKADDTMSGRAVADRALAELAQLYARLGRYESLRALFAEIEGRNVRGSAAELVQGAREGFWLMENEPGWAFRCGPIALASILAQGKSDYKAEPLFEEMQSTRQGTSLAQLAKLSAEAGMPMQVAFREPGSPVVAVDRAVVHWKAGHYAALVKRVGGRWLVQDPTFGESIWVSTSALSDETSGYFLIPAGPLPEGWRNVPEDEAGTVWGKGAANTSEPDAQKPDDQKEPPCNDCPCPGPEDEPKGGGSGDEPKGGGDGGGGDDDGMPVWSVHSMLVSLNITDTPWRYSPPRGPAVRFRITYNQRDSFQPQTFNYSNLGYKWTFDWLSYVQEATSGSTTTISVYRRGGGREVYSFAGDTSSPHYRSRAVLVRTSPDTYERRLPNGSKEIFALATGASPLRRIFMTKITDPYGTSGAENALTLTYDGDLRLTEVRDALGQVSTLSYELGGASGTPEFYRITRVTDPFGRAAVLSYNNLGQLASVTDAIGMTSTFDYENNVPGDFLRSMTTPYGATTFQWGTVSAKPIDRYIEITDPLGEKQRVQFTTLYNMDFGPVPSVPGAPAVSFQALTTGHVYATAYWDKRTYQHAPDFTKAARQTTWLTTLNGHEVSSVPHSMKLPLQARKWFAYPDQPLPRMWGSDSRPIVVARVLDDVSPTQTEIRRFEYSQQGRLKKYTDPVGRTTEYTYQTNGGIDDLATVKQANPAALSGNGYDLLASYTYTDATHPNSIHRPLTFTDAARQQWTFVYNSFGQLTTVETPPRAGISENRTTTLEYDGQGYLARLTGPSPQATYSFGYDTVGRARSATDPSGYTVLADYDALDRVIKTTYPDGSFEQTTYDRLDATEWRDRQGRVTSTLYDALRRPISVRDPAGRVLRYEWCNCGSLSALIDARDNATRWERDDQNRVTKETRADSTIKTWQYRAKAGYLWKATNARAHTATRDYYLDGRLKQVANSDPNTPGFTLLYDSVYPRLSQVTDEAGLWQYGYYPVPALAPAPTQLGATQVSTVDGPLANDTLGFTYDELGRRRSRTLASTTLGWDYDLLGRTSQHTTPMGAFTFGYDGGTSRLLSVLYPSGQSTTYSYRPPSQDLRLEHIYNRKPGGAQLSHFAYTYDTVGNIQTWLNEVENQPTRTWTYGYDRADQLLSARLPGPDGTSNPETYAYAYDDAGNRIAEQAANLNAAPPLIEGVRSTWSYNAMNQLVNQSAAAGPVAMRGTTNEPATVTVGGQPASTQASSPGVAFDGTSTPDANSEVTVQATDMSGLTTSNKYQIPASTGPRSFLYDLDGNMTSDGTRTFEWDANNHLRRVLQGATEVARFKYDVQGRRVQKVAAGVTRDYVYDGPELAEERASNGITLRFFHGLGIDQHLAQVDGSGTARYFAADHVGSMVQQTDPTGSVTLTRQYDPWGKLVLGSSAGRYAFTGREWDPETGLYYYRARYYDPNLGRFLSEDPIGFEAGPNVFSYVLNNPVTLTDPFGMMPDWLKAIALALGLMTGGDPLPEPEPTPPSQEEQQKGPKTQPSPKPQPTPRPKPPKSRSAPNAKPKSQIPKGMRNWRVPRGGASKLMKFCLPLTIALEIMDGGGLSCDEHEECYEP